MTAALDWAEQLAAWAIDPLILAGAPESPYAFPPELFAAHDHPAASPLLDFSREVLPPGGTVLDVGAGAGAASLPLFPPGGHLHAVDSQPRMLAALTEAAAGRGVRLTTYVGSWPDEADRVPAADVVVCAHLAYNVPDLAGMAAALTEHARHRVVMELTAEHPWVPLGPLWQHFHHQPRPTGPTADLAVGVLQEAGIDPRVTDWERPAVELRGERLTTYVAFTRRRLCLPEQREPEVADLVRRHPPAARRSVVLSWPGAATA